VPQPHLPVETLLTMLMTGRKSPTNFATARRTDFYREEKHI